MRLCPSLARLRPSVESSIASSTWRKAAVHPAFIWTSLGCELIKDQSYREGVVWRINVIGFLIFVIWIVNFIMPIFIAAFFMLFVNFFTKKLNIAKILIYIFKYILSMPLILGSIYLLDYLFSDPGKINDTGRAIYIWASMKIFPISALFVFPCSILMAKFGNFLLRHFIHMIAFFSKA